MVTVVQLIWWRHRLSLTPKLMMQRPHKWHYGSSFWCQCSTRTNWYTTQRQKSALIRDFIELYPRYRTADLLH